MSSLRFAVEILVDAELVANDDFALTPANTPVNVPILANDTLGDAPVALEDLAGPPAIVRAPWIGTATTEDDGTITYVPPPGFCGTVSFDYEIEKPAPPEPEPCVQVYNNYANLYYTEDGEPIPDWWGVAESITIDVPSGTYHGVWDSELGAYFGEWPESCSDEDGTISWADGNSSPVCAFWICPA